MKAGNTNLSAKIPVPEAAYLVAFSAKNSVPLPLLVGYYVLKALYGAMHPAVADFESSLSGPPLVGGNEE